MATGVIKFSAVGWFTMMMLLPKLSMYGGSKQVPGTMSPQRESRTTGSTRQSTTSTTFTEAMYSDLGESVF